MVLRVTCIRISLFLPLILELASDGTRIAIAQVHLYPLNKLINLIQTT
jgi:hypothetical protein